MDEKRTIKITGKIHPVVFIVITVILVVVAALCGYQLTKQYKDLITSAYENAVSSITDRIDTIQNNVIDEVSKIENSTVSPEESSTVSHNPETPEKGFSSGQHMEPSEHASYISDEPEIG